MRKRVLVVAAHPDDEVLGAGATIHRLSKEGHSVCVAIASKECKTREGGLADECAQSHEVLGVKESRFGDFECMAFDRADHYEMVEFIEEAICEFGPDAVVTHHPSDIHPDHRTLSLCTLEAVRLPQRQIKDIKRIERVMFMEVPSSTDWSANPSLARFSPNLYARVGESDVQAKIDALRVYEGVVRTNPHPRSEVAIKALAEKRGSEYGYPMAEAFQIAFGEAF